MDKICTKCNVGKPVSEFYKNKRRAGGLSSSCKQCDDKSNKATRYKDPEKARSYRNAYKAGMTQRVNEWKSNIGCNYCSERTACCLELHHLDPSTKEGHPSMMRTSWDRFIAEAEKCIVVCSNCHKKLHAGLLL